MHDFLERLRLRALRLRQSRRFRTLQAGQGTEIGSLAQIYGVEGIRLGSRVKIFDYALLSCVEGQWSSPFATPRTAGALEIGDGTKVCSYAMIYTYGGQVKIGRKCSFNPYCVVYGPNVTIGDHVRIGTHSVIVAQNHIFEDHSRPIYQQGVKSIGIQIGDDVWIGAGARICDGVIIGTGSVIGAGAVVTKNVPDFAVVAGVPARVVRWRKNPEQDASVAGNPVNNADSENKKNHVVVGSET